jgi:hypothetical protein
MFSFVQDAGDYRHNVWFFIKFLFKNCDFAIKRYVLCLKISNFLLKLQVFRLQCSNVVLNFKVSQLQFRLKRREGDSIIDSLRYCVAGFLITFGVGHGISFPKILTQRKSSPAA